MNKLGGKIINVVIVLILLIVFIIMAVVLYHSSKDTLQADGVSDVENNVVNLLSNSGFNVFNMGKDAKINYTFDDDGLVIRWMPGDTNIVENNIVRFRQYKSLDVKGKKVNMVLDMEGKGGLLSFIFLEKDDDFWTFYIPMDEKYMGNITIDPYGMRLGEWSTGDGKFNKSAVIGFQMEVLADKHHLAEEQTIRIGKLDLV